MVEYRCGFRWLHDEFVGSREWQHTVFACRGDSDHATIRGVIGIAAARKDGVLPLPGTDELVVQPPETAPVLDHTALELPEDLLSPQSDDDVVLDTRDTAPARVRKWKRSLLDLSTRNRLLNLKPSTQVIDLNVPSSGLARLDDLAHAGKPITLVANDELSSIHQLQGARKASEIDPELLLTYLREDHKAYATVTRETYTRRFKELSRTARTMFEETGSSNLYLTLGALMHRTSTGVEARAPLFLLPVKITGGTGRSPFRFEVDTTGTASPNHCLVEWLRLKHNVSIEALESPRLDESGIDIVHSLRGIRAALVENKLDLRIDEVATISICQFGTFGMWKDLSDHWDLLEQSPIVRHLTHHAGESFRDSSVTGEDSLESAPVDEVDVPVPIPADGSQLRAVAMAAEGRTFVLEGPARDWKVADDHQSHRARAEQGKTVLFVAEKQAALDVVKKRLARVGLSDFTSICTERTERNAIREQLRRAIEQHPAVQRIRLVGTARRVPGPGTHRSTTTRAGSTVATASTIRCGAPTKPRSRSATDRRRQCRRPTSRTRRLLAATSPAHSRASRVPPGRWRYAPAAPGPSSAASPTSTRWNRFPQQVCVSPAPWMPPWPMRSAWKTLGLLDDPDELATLLPHARRQVGRIVPDSRTLEWWRSAHYAATRDALFAEVNRLHQNCAPLLATFTPMFLESGDVNAFVLEAEESTKGLFGKKKRLDQFQHNLAPHAVAGTDLTPTTVLPLLRTIPTARAHIAQLRDQMHGALGPYAPPYWNPLAPDAAASLGSAFEYVAATAEFAERDPIAWGRLTRAGFPSNTVMAVLDEVDDAWREWRRVLGTHADDLARWKQDEDWTVAWQRDASTWRKEIEEAGSRRLVNWGRMSAFLDPLRTARLDDFVDALLRGNISASDAEVAFIRGAATASVTERRLAESLNNFDTALRDGEIDDFVRAADTLRDEQTKALPAALLARRPFQHGALRGDVAELRRQLDRKRGGTTFRQLMTRYGQHILAATPCMFVSPASLAQFVPPGSATFDLVVFDEASQMTVPHAIGALGRGAPRWSSATPSRCRRPRSGRSSTKATKPTRVAPSPPTTSRASSPSACSRRCRGCGCRGTTAARTSR